MIEERQIEIAKRLLATGLVAQVYHSVELFTSDNGLRLPIFKQGTEGIYVGPDDRQQMFAYIRQTGPVTTRSEEKEGSDVKMYWMQVPTRIVVFHDHEERNFDLLTRQLLAPVFFPEISLVSFNHDAEQLAQQESPLVDFAFGVDTFYLAIDVMVRMRVTRDECDVKNCIVHPNPICS